MGVSASRANVPSICRVTLELQDESWALPAHSGLLRTTLALAAERLCATFLMGIQGRTGKTRGGPPKTHVREHTINSLVDSTMIAIRGSTLPGDHLALEASRRQSGFWGDHRAHLRANTHTGIHDTDNDVSDGAQ